ncbi:TolC family protein [Pseudogulbenkiania sp. MAI-1]|uniref:TolC family protein n=1 Tax=Pseudogulbenkiania sp. MAI-1 TaxID=990370 RepID=UPI00045E69F2|nr:TolC family protein [Pseudogulbenkiania sp. MAI-1]
MNNKICLASFVSLLGMSALVMASPVEESSIKWREANEQVSQFPRGHADILKWEQANTPKNSKEPEAKGLPLLSAEAVVRQAWLAHPDLASPLRQFGSGNVQLIASGRWIELDPAVSLRIEDSDEVLDVARDARQAWLVAVAAKQGLQHQQDALEATEAAAELAKRMAKVGNWSRLQQAQEQSALIEAQQQWRRVQNEANQSRVALLKVLNLWTRNKPQAIALPERLPDLPSDMMTPEALQARLDFVVPRLPRKEQIETRANAQLAYDVYRAAYQQARSYRDDVLKLRQFIYDESVLRYNGMLMNVWELLAETKARSLAVDSAIQALRDFWLAEADLQFVLQGGAPDSFVSLSGGSADAAAPGGH